MSNHIDKRFFITAEFFDLFFNVAAARTDLPLWFCQTTCAVAFTSVRRCVGVVSISPLRSHQLDLLVWRRSSVATPPSCFCSSAHLVLRRQALAWLIHAQESCARSSRPQSHLTVTISCFRFHHTNLINQHLKKSSVRPFCSSILEYLRQFAGRYHVQPDQKPWFQYSSHPLDGHVSLEKTLEYHAFKKLRAQSSESTCPWPPVQRTVILTPNVCAACSCTLSVFVQSVRAP